MQKLGIRGAAHKAGLAGVFAGTLLLAFTHTASAQSSPTTSPTDAPSEAARRAAASPYRFILQSSAAPRKAAAPAPAAPAAEPKKAAAPAPVQQAAALPTAPTPASKAPTAPEPSPAAAPPTPEPAVASVSRQPAAEPLPVRREIIPVRTDEPHLSAALLREQPKGTVKIRFDINYDGSVGEVTVVSSNNRVLNKPTVEAVHGWKFQPVDEVLTVETEVAYDFDK